MAMKQISTEKAPAAIGPYSQAIEHGGFIFVSGQLPIDHSTGKIDVEIAKGVVITVDKSFVYADATASQMQNVKNEK